MLTFNAEGHVYFWNGKEVPSVSQILKKIGITRDYEKVDPFYRERGKFVHKAVEYHIKGTLDEQTLDQENILPYVQAFKNYETQTGYKVSHTEVPLYSKKMGFAGTIDHLSRLAAFATEGIVDIKVTESSDKAADLQLCAYSILYHENFGRWPAFRLVLELHGDKTTKIIPYRTNPKIWKAVMALWKWKTTRR